MNVLFLSLTFPDRTSPERGTYNLGLCAALAQTHRVHAIVPRGWHECLGAGVRKAYEPSAETQAAGVSVDFPIYWYLPRVMPQSRGAALWHSIRPRVASLSKTFRPDVVLSYWAYPDGDAGRRAAKHFGVPSVVIVGGSDVLLMPKEPGNERVIREVLQQSSCVATVSDGLRRAAIGLGVPADAVRTIRQGIDPHVFQPGDRAAARRRLAMSDDEEALVWVGRMVPVKNLDMLVTAVAAAAHDRPHLKLHLIGDGQCRAPLEARIAAEGLQKLVRFEGPAPHDRLPDWYRSANLTVLSSHSEGLPNVLRESLACGTPYVSVDVGDISEISGPGGTLVPAGNPVAFARAIIEALGDAATRPTPTSRARTWLECAEDFTVLFEDLRRDRSLERSKLDVSSCS